MLIPDNSRDLNLSMLRKHFFFSIAYHAEFFFSLPKSRTHCLSLGSDGLIQSNLKLGLSTNGGDASPLASC